MKRAETPNDQDDFGLDDALEDEEFRALAVK